ncbi:hypothetical protein A1O3_07185 [Capronia epimyces CBS 606.96]|uniref:DUF895 domain membrane protein n=1 Tax=Capronia epimyces CBS 606.96 TaxID=1182542 RepID=W9XK77_9EURO|nr:uncharacterized protein A1O3_07185 [Capronia epimyces CBS 606.96]EXJ80897.1 hypothetical protein A1O3_07185 [Capronia epimyces CBS 606.96]
MAAPNLSKWRLNRPFNQNLVMACLLFCLPGIYLALTGLGAGGGGPNALVVAQNTNAILYGIFTLSGWIGGATLNLLKPRVTIAFGSIGYPIYVGGLFYFDTTGHSWLAYFSGVVLGITAGWLWTGASYIALSYAEEQYKGTYLAIQWALNSLGGTVGAAIAFGISFNATGATGVSSAVYGTFIAIMLAACIASWFLVLDPKTIVRDDGTHIAEFEPTNIRTELGHLRALVVDWKMYALVPTFIASEMCLATVSSINSYYFSLRARSLNNVLFQFIMVLAAIALSFLLDMRRLSRRRRGLIACSCVGVITMAACAGLVGWMKVNGLDGRLPVSPDVDWTSGRFAGGVVLYLLWGIVYASYLISANWVVGSLSNDPARCAMYCGFAKGTASLGLCICFILDTQSVTYMTQVIMQFVLYAVGSLTVIYMLVYHVTDTNYFTEAHVIAPTHVQEEAATKTAVVETKDAMH